MIAWIIACIFLTSCTSAPVATNRIDPKDSAVKIHPENIVEDAARIREFNIFPKAVTTSLNNGFAQGGENRKTFSNIKNFLCNGDKPKIRPTLSVKVIPPKAPKEIALDVVVEAKKNFLKYAKYFLQTRFFSSTVPDKGGVEVNPDYSAILKNNNDTRPPRNLMYNFPVIKSQGKSEIEKFYQTLLYVPRFYELRWIENFNEPNSHIDSQFFSLWLGDTSVILVPKAGLFATAGWDDDRRPTKPFFTTAAMAESSDTLPKIKSGKIGDDSDHDFLKKISHVMGSEYGWQSDEQGLVFPLQAAFSKDLEFLYDHFTFIFSRDSIKQAFGYNDELVTQHFGPDFFTEKFSPAVALQNKNMIWSLVLWKSTELKESQQSDGTVLYDVSLNFKLFCQFSTPVADLQSE